MERESTSHGIQRVPQVPFAQIANAALRDARLSFRARGILAMVLSHTGEWQASRDWIVDQSDREGREAVQTALNELTDLGYRRVVKERQEDGTIRTYVEWSHESTDRPETRPPVEPSVFQNTIQNTPPSEGETPSEPAPPQEGEPWPFDAPPEDDGLATVIALRPTDLVGEFVRTWQEIHGEPPTARTRSQAGREAKALLREGRDPGQVAEAVRGAARAGFGTVSVEYDKITRGDGWVMPDRYREAGWVMLPNHDLVSADGRALIPAGEWGWTGADGTRYARDGRERR
jgi:hypothetical protein